MKFSFIIYAIIWFGSYITVLGQNADITVNVKGIKAAKGIIQIGLFDNKENFPDRDKVFAGAEPKATSNVISYTFKNIPSGNYAIAIFHDIDSNKKLKKNKLGIPVEGFGFSNSNKILGVPKFKDALFEVTSDISIVIVMNYL